MLAANAEKLMRARAQKVEVLANMWSKRRTEEKLDQEVGSGGWLLGAEEVRMLNRIGEAKLEDPDCPALQFQSPRNRGVPRLQQVSPLGAASLATCWAALLSPALQQCAPYRGRGRGRCWRGHSARVQPKSSGTGVYTAFFFFFVDVVGGKSRRAKGAVESWPQMAGAGTGSHWLAWGGGLVFCVRQDNWPFRLS